MVEGRYFDGYAAPEEDAPRSGLVCFTPGIRIATARGHVPVEQIAVGDLLQTADNGFQPVVWIGRRDLDAADLARSPQLKPILIQPGSMLGNRVALRVSPEHRFLLAGGQLGEMGKAGEAFIRAKLLPYLPQSRVRSAKGARHVTYIHIMTEHHEVVFAEGIRTETFWPGPEALRALEPQAFSQLVALFPELLDVEGIAAQCATAARLARMDLNRGQVMAVASGLGESDHILSRNRATI